jgi:cyclophilin family peptidyl-prolyl cis-trans isomerase
VGTAKRERQKAGRQARLVEAQQAQAKRQRFKLVRNLAIVGVVVIAVLFVLSRDSGDDDVTASATTTAADDTGTTAGGSSTTASTEAPASTVTVTIPPAGAAIEGETPCPPTDGSAERTTSFAEAPPTCIDPDTTYLAAFETSEGSFTVQLDQSIAPITVNNFVVLARYHFYDGVTFHRIIPGFMNQGGDAVGPQPGQGDPGYTIPDELPADASVYTAGTIAMANAGPDTGGSQFFIVVGDGGSQLTPDYTPFGHVTSGQDVVDRINQFGDAATNGTPTKEVVITAVVISEL